MKPTFEEELEKPKNKAILSFLGNIKGISVEELKQLKLIVLWEAIETFDSSKGCLFSTHLYNRCRYTYLNTVKKKFIPTAEFIEISYQEKDSILEDFPVAYKQILKDRFISKYSIHELIKMYNLNKKQIKILLDDSISYLKRNL